MNVSTSGESPAGAGQNDGADSIVILDRRQLLIDLARQLVAHGVQFFRPVQSNQSDLLDAFRQNISVAHSPLLRVRITTEKLSARNYWATMLLRAHRY